MSDPSDEIVTKPGHLTVDETVSRLVELLRARALKPLAALDLPLKVLVWDDAGQTKVSYISPQALAARHGLPGELAARLEGIDAVTDAVLDG